MRRYIPIVLLIVAAVVLGAAGFAIGRHTAPSPDVRGGYNDGVQLGHSEGVAEGRALQEGAALTGSEKDAATDAFKGGYRAGLNDAFSGYDGGWYTDAPYVVVLGTGVGGATYRIASRTPLQAGVNYYLCPDGKSLCQSKR
jgi:hypothetical protein